MSRSGSDHSVPADLLLVVASVVFAAVVAFSPAGAWTPLAIVVGIPFVVLVPGYALVSAVFPRAGEAAPGATTRTSWLARLGLSVGGSVVAVAVVGGVLDFTIWGFQRTAVVGGLCLLTLLATAVAWSRRRRVPADVRAGTDFGSVRDRTVAVVTDEGTLGIALTVLVLVAGVGAVGVVAQEATDAAGVTEFYLLGENDAGELRAGDHPTELTVGDPTTVGVGVGARGPDGFDGTVVGRLERVTVENDTVTVTDSEELVRFPVSVAAGESAVTRHTIRPTTAGDALRLTYRLYRSDAQSPVRQVHVWVRVSDGP
ncbi:DUF1616 domain-containing protein [Haloarcula pellucida]|uniref:DUF1616 domain-containing protein n=1 Tax=Haloarcula pellucida TaxID=1427151 RepID=A0A830GRA5_9EURY|nr:DUF1616 domain-containing protein [Halomicroarcula pellucida]MBX0350213.1 DUF1616 domain-containing protein [Halomicroarcula pellucida]GGO00938.1 hypothetical protein GCM10009030_34120 [Halomicroarcula pellucida]